MRKDLKHCMNLEYFEYYNLSIFHQKDALFELIAPIVADKIYLKVEWYSRVVFKIAILNGLSKGCHCRVLCPIKTTPI